MALRLDSRASGFDLAFDRLVEARRGAAADVGAAAAAILADVRTRGDAAVIDCTERFDGVRLTPETMRVSAAEIAAARAECAPRARDALALAARRVEAYHRRQMPASYDETDGDGVRLGWRFSAVAAAGIYVPGGTAAYPSSVLMNAIPARVAGVARIAMCVPAPKGALNPLVLAAAELAGVDEVYRVGGAQAIGALAFGTATIARVDKIVGPGNAYVAAAKRQVAGSSASTWRPARPRW